MKKISEKITREVKKALKDMNGCHDFDHTERVLNLCMHIGKKEKADLEILEFAALLHDIGREEEMKTRGKTCHAEHGASLSRVILEKHKLPKDKIDRIIHCIETHRFRRGNAPISKEAKILFDADKLDSIGALGLGRAFLFAGELGAKLHNHKTDLSKTKSYSRDDTAFREFNVKLSKIKDRMFTKEGARLAKERHEFMCEFFDRMDMEIEGEL